jgi:hypothetical protein
MGLSPARLAGLALVLVTAGCGGKPSNPGAVTDGGAGCQSTRSFFVQQVWGPVLAARCLKCHSPDGVAVVDAKSSLVLQPPTWPGFLDANLATLAEVSRTSYEGQSLLLIKPTGGAGHGGGAVLQEGDPGLAALRELLARLSSPETCADEPPAVSLEGVELLDARRTFRKAALHWAGRLPTADEDAALVAGGEAALEPALDMLSREPAFLQRVEWEWNDLLLTDKYQWKGRGWPVALNLLNGTDYPGAATLRQAWDADRWAGLDDAQKRARNDAVGREPLRLLAWIVSRDRPFSEVLTASYAVVDDDSAAAYGVNDGKTGLREAQVKYPDGTTVPHAGILSTPAFLNRWPTTPTNRSRGRARFLLKNFLATDILNLADRPVDVALVTQQDNPTLNAQQCTVCHRVLDPLAGAFRGYDEGDYERFDPQRPWHPDMFHPGFGEQDLPSPSYGAALPWLAQQLTADPRFDRAVVLQAFRAVTGQQPLPWPAGPAGASFDEALAAWSAQDALFRELETSFRADNRNYRKLLVALLRSPWYRAASAPGADESQLSRLRGHGTARWLGPEVLNRKLAALTGVRWRQLWEPEKERDWLNDSTVAALYGGIDSDATTQRATAPNGVMSNLAWRMALELSCMSVPSEFAKEPSARVMLPGAVQAEIPESAGHPVPGAIANIRASISALSERLTGEPPPEEEVDAAYAVFYETWKEIADGPLAQKGLDWPCTVDGKTFQQLPEPVRRDATGTVRAWMAVVSYLLADAQVLHE